MAPYAALTLLSILMSIVVTLTVVEHIVLFCRAHREAAVPVHNAVRTKARHAAPQARYNAKKYLFFCSMLC